MQWLRFTYADKQLIWLLGIFLLPLFPALPGSTGLPWFETEDNTIPLQEMLLSEKTTPQQSVRSIHSAIHDNARVAFLLNRPVNINAADEVALAMLPGIGKKTASLIVQDRERSGPYHTVDDLQRIRGIGKKTTTRLAPYLRCGNP
ncbi:MAG: hypothetical protein CSA34_02235 [Desulfobulbus propionicus]|nr:MAG: hypothetical protein CSA34_02235 [Desulfobulbus propionicus]